MNTIINNPVIPCVMSLPGGHLQQGNLIVIHGQPTYNSNRFAINLLHQGNMQCVFHFNARFDQNQTVRNTNFPSSSWGHEERSALPFSRNRHFFMEIRCLPDRFLVRFLPQITCRVALAALAYTYNVTYTGSYLFFAFCVSLICGRQRELGDIAFQLTAHFDTNWVIRNSKLNKEWGVEEGTTTHKFPFKRLQPFKIEIFTSPSSYLIAIDGNHHCEYNHRVSYSEANTLQIIGDVQISMIEFKSAHTFPTFPSSNRLNVAYPPLPFASLINGPLSVGNEIQVHGQVKPHPNRFHINLQIGCQSYPTPTIAFHFNPRYEGGQRTIVMNSFIGSWGTEQRIAIGRNLLPGNSFVLVIRRQPSYFEVLVNGSLITTYNHRIAAEMVDSVTIDGDVIINKVVAI